MIAPPVALASPSGRVAGRIGLGTWAIGGSEWGGTDRQASIASIRAALDAGVTLIDTAPIYGFGLSEEIVGEAIAGRRDEVIVATKCGLVWDEGGGEYAYTNERGDIHRVLSPASLRRQVDASLRRLGIERIDLYQTHFQDGSTPIAETMGALRDIAREGKIAAIGVCNVSAAQLAAYIACGGIVTDQEQYNMIDRRHEADLIPACVAHGIGVLAYSPLAMGLLSGRVVAGRTYAAGDVRGFSRRFAPAVTDPVNAFLADLAPIAADHGLTIAQLVVAWTLAQPGIACVLSGVRTVEQAHENIASGAVTLAPDTVATIDRRLAAAALRAPQVYD